jgi:hypothetical protein
MIAGKEIAGEPLNGTLVVFSKLHSRRKALTLRDIIVTPIERYHIERDFTFTIGSRSCTKDGT